MPKSRCQQENGHLVGSAAGGSQGESREEFTEQPAPREDASDLPQKKQFEINIGPTDPLRLQGIVLFTFFSGEKQIPEKGGGQNDATTPPCGDP